MQTVLGIILGGGAGSRLYPLTKKRAKPAVPLGANYRLIDIPVSNCINSNVNKIYCLTQFNSASLNRHLSQAYVRASPNSNPAMLGHICANAVSRAQGNAGRQVSFAEQIQYFSHLGLGVLAQLCEDVQRALLPLHSCA